MNVSRLSALLAAIFVVATVHAAPSFLGPIPVQYANSGSEVILDMHRFYQPDGEPMIVPNDVKGVKAAFDPKSFQLRLKIAPEAKGLIDLPFKAGEQASVVTLVIRPAGPGRRAEDFGIFAARLDDATLSINSTGKIAAQSAVAEMPDGLVKPVLTKATDVGIDCLIAGLPGGAAVRVVAADANGNASNTVLVPIGKPRESRWQDAVMYYTLTDRFADGDKSNDRPVENAEVKWPANFHGGDWRGITQKIEEGYFERLGVNTLWLGPLNENPAIAFQESPEPHRWYTGYHGYWPVSSTNVEPHFGDAVALKALVQSAHAHGLKVIADLVLHHVHEQHPWWKEHRDWFGQLELPDGTKNLRLWDAQQFTTWFEPYLPTFNFAREEAVKALIENSVWWANEYELDGFRLDAVKHIPQAFWPKFRSAMREQVEQKRGRPFYLVGETFKDRTGIDSFVGPNMLDGQFDFPLYDSIKDAFGLEKTGLDALEASLAASEAAFGKEALMSPLIGNHDKGRFMAYADGDLPDPKIAKEEEVGWTKPPAVDHAEAYAKIKLAEALLMSIDGVPMIYYGDEIGMTGAGDPDNRRDMRFGSDVTTPEQEVLKNFEQLGKIRREHRSLRYGSRRVLVAEKDLLVFVRAYLDDRVLCVFNRNAAPLERTLRVKPELAGGDYTNVLGNQTATVSGGQISVTVPGRSAAFFIRRSLTSGSSN